MSTRQVIFIYVLVIIASVLATYSLCVWALSK